MVAKTKRNNLKSKKNVTKVAFIQYQLKIRGYTQRDIAKSLAISEQAVSMAIYGQSKIPRVDEWLYENLGLEIAS